MAEYYQIDGITFTLGATFPSFVQTGQQINYFFDGFIPGATYYFAVMSYDAVGFSGYSNLVSVHLPEFPLHTPIALTWFNNYSTRNRYIAKAYNPSQISGHGGGIFPNPSPAPPGVPQETIPTAAQVKTWFDGNTSESGIRAIIPSFVFNSWFAPVIMDAYGISYQNCYHPDDACKDAFGNVVEQELFNIPTNSEPTFQNNAKYRGVQSFASPWMDGATDRVKPIWGAWLDSVEALGITFDYFMGNIADTNVPSPLGYFGSMIRREGSFGAGYTLHLGHVVNDPRAESLTAGNAEIYGNLKTQLLLDQGYTLTDFSISQIEDGTTGAYKLLNFVVGRLGGYYMNEGFYGPIQERYPNAQVSNYGTYTILKEDEVPDYNGHKQYFDVRVGNARSPICYAEMIAAGSVYKVNTTDPTKLTYVYDIPPEDRYGYDSNGKVNAWKAFLLDQQKLRALVRNMTPGEKLHPWIKGPADSINGALGGWGAEKRAEYWKENILHIAMFNPEAFFLFNQFGGERDVTDLIEEVTNLKNQKRAFSLPQNKNKINFNTKFLVSGCKTSNGTFLWRLTTNYDTVTNLVINSYNHIMSSYPGRWFSTGTDSSPFIEKSYDPVTKTLTMEKVGLLQIPGLEEPYSAMPTGLTALTNPLGATLSWYDNSQTEIGFKIFYRPFWGSGTRF